MDGLNFQCQINSSELYTDYHTATNMGGFNTYNDNVITPDESPNNPHDDGESSDD